jgi:hypothetical protein
MSNLRVEVVGVSDYFVGFHGDGGDSRSGGHRAFLLSDFVLDYVLVLTTGWNSFNIKFNYA